MLKQLLLSIPTLFLCLSSSVCAANSPCPAYVEPEIVTTPFFQEPNIDHMQPASDLKAMAEEEDTINKAENIFISGLTVYGKRTSTNFSVQTHTYPNGMVCAQIVKLNLSLRIEKTIVYVANEIPQEACLFQAVLAHEHKHVAMAKDLLNLIQQPSKDNMRVFLRQLGVIKASSADEATAQIDKAIGDYMGQFNTNLTKLFQSKQLEIDTPEEYSRVDNLCGGDVQLYGRRAAGY